MTLPSRVLDPLDQIRLLQPPAIGDRAVRAGEVELMDAERPERERGDGVLVVVERVELEAQPLGHGNHVLGADELLRLADRDVERVLQRVADADRASLSAVGIRRVEALGDIGPDVHEHRGRADDAATRSRRRR